MQDMVEPDRTIVIVSVIGLVVIWGSVLYHKVVQGGGGASAPEPDAQAADEAAETPSPTAPEKSKKRHNRKRK